MVKKHQSAFMSDIKQICKDVNEMANQHFYIMCVCHLWLALLQIPSGCARQACLLSNCMVVSETKHDKEKETECKW